MAAWIDLVNRPLVRAGLVVAAIASFTAGASAAINAGGPSTPTAASAPRPANDINWMVAEHQAPPYFDAARNLVLGSTPQAKCGRGSLPETSWQGRVPASDFADGRALKG